MPPRADWIKLYSRDLNDPAFLQLDWASRGVFDALQRLSKTFSEMKGYLVTNGQAMTPAQIAIALGASSLDDEATVMRAIERCVDTGLLELTGHSGYHIRSWEERQAAEIREPKDKVAARVKRWRAAQKTHAETEPKIRRLRS